MPPGSGELVTDEREQVETRAPRRLRVSLICDAAAERNGVGSYYRDLADHLKERRQVIDFISPTRKTSGVYIMSVPLPGDRTQRLRFPNVPSLFWRVRRFDPHVVLVSSPGPFGVFGLYVALRNRIPLCVCLHTDYEELANLYWKSCWRHVSRQYLLHMNRLLIRYSDAVLTVSDTLTRNARFLGGRTVGRVGSPLPLEFLNHPVRRRADRIRRILFAGRLAPEKNLPAVLDAARKLPGLQFGIAGEGPLRPMVEREAARLANVTYHGWVARRDLRELLDASDLLVLPSHVESFGTVALEAAARKRLFLVSGACGLKEWATLDIDALTMRPGETLSAAIRRLAAMDGRVRRTMEDRLHDATLALNEDTLTTWESTFRRLAGVKRIRRKRHPSAALAAGRGGA